MRRVTPSSIEALKPEAARYEVTDPAIPGLQLRVEPTGAKHWQLRYYWQGKRQKLALGTWPKGRQPGMNLEAAHAAALKARELLRAGIDPRRAERTKRTGTPTARLPRSPRLTPAERPATPAPHPSPFDAALAEPRFAEALADRHSVPYLAREYVTRHVRAQRKRPEYVERFLVAEVLTPQTWAARDARTITPREVVELLDGIVERGSPTMANRGAGILSQMFRYGVHRAIVDASPVQLLYRPGGREKPRERALADDEIGALLRNVESVARFQTGDGKRSPRLAHVLRLLLLTGQRRGEIALASWSDVTLTGKRPAWLIPAEHSKTGAPHTVPLSPAAVREFEALAKYANGSAYVFPTDDGSAPADPRLITRGLARYLERLQTAAAEEKPPVTLEPFTVHDLRRTCRTGLARLKVPHDVGERILNHKLPAMREVYDQHQPLEEMRAALEKWAAYLAKLEAGAARITK